MRVTPSRHAESRQRQDVSAPTWIRELARPYLRGYRARPQTGSHRVGWVFQRRLAAQAQAGFFVGYLSRWPGEVASELAVPGAMVSAFLRPVGSPAFYRFVAAEQSLFRWTSTYINWLTHRPPRFAFSPTQEECLWRYCSRSRWPESRWEHYARNFFIETLALLVRSGLVRRLKSC